MAELWKCPGLSHRECCLVWKWWKIPCGNTSGVSAVGSLHHSVTKFLLCADVCGEGGSSSAGAEARLGYGGGWVPER